MKKPLRRPEFALLLGLLAAAGIWYYTDSILIPFQVSDAAAKGVPRGNLSDLYPRWLGARELLLHERNPYSHEVTREIQGGYYGRPLEPERPNDPKDQQAFAYPLYVVFLLAPTVRLPFHDVQLGFRWLLVLLTIASVPLWLSALRWRPSPITVVTWIVIALGSFPAIQGLKLQQLSLLVCALLAACAAAVASGALALGGVLLALATIKPQLTAIMAAWLLLWAAADWRSRKRLTLSFAGTMAVLLLGSELLLPGWMAHFRAATADYWRYTGGGKSILDVGLGVVLGKTVALILLLALAIFCWRMRRKPADSSAFASTLVLVVAVTIVVIPTFALYNHLLLLPAFMLVTRSSAELWQKGSLPRFFLVLTGMAVFWPWFTAALADVALLFLPRQLLLKAWVVPLFLSLAVPLALLGMVVVCAPVLLRSGATTNSVESA